MRRRAAFGRLFPYVSVFSVDPVYANEAEGIQAQTLSVYHHAVDADLTLLPVINKVDLPHADPVAASKEIASSLGLPVETHMRISAKSGLGVQNVLSNIVDNLPPPDNWNGDTRLRGLVFDTLYVSFCLLGTKQVS